MQSTVSKLTLLLVAIVAPVTCSITPQECSKYLCRNSTHKDGQSYYGYFGGVDFQNTWLKTTLLENTTAINDKDCVKKCLHNEECFSMNAGPVQIMIDEKGRNVKFVECHLIADTAYTKPDDLVNRTNWIHVTAEHSGCSKFPCKNGGRCIPDYTEDTYECECELEYWGVYCERERPYAVGGTAPEEAYCHNPFTHNGVEHKDCIIDEPMPDGTNLPWCGANEGSSEYGVCSFTRLLPAWRFLFDDDSTTVENSGSKGSGLAAVSLGSAKEVYVPDRKGKVLYCDGSGLIPGIAAGTTGNTFDIYMHTTPHELGQTVSLWVKISRKDPAHQAGYSTPHCRIASQTETGWTMAYRYGSGDWFFQMRSTLMEASFTASPTDPYVWTHLAATFIAVYNGTYVDSGTIRTFVNGVHQGDGFATPHGLTFSGTTESFGLFSHNGDAGADPCILWGDDYMFFDSALTDEKIQELYELGKLDLVG